MAPPLPGTHFRLSPLFGNGIFDHGQTRLKQKNDDGRSAYPEAKMEFCRWNRLPSSAGLLISARLPTQRLTDFDEGRHVVEKSNRPR